MIRFRRPLSGPIPGPERFRLRLASASVEGPPGIQTVPLQSPSPLLARLHGHADEDRARPPDVFEVLDVSDLVVTTPKSAWLQVMLDRIFEIAPDHDVVVEALGRSEEEILLLLRDARDVELEGALDISAAASSAGYPLSAQLLRDGRVVGPATSRGLAIVRLDSEAIGLPDAQRLSEAVRALQAAFPEPEKVHFSLASFLDKRGHETPWAFGRSTYKYTDCGPWVAFIAPGHGSHGAVYYEDSEARVANASWWTSCLGLRIGSIVEGSDVEVGPEELLWPFTDEQLDAAIARIDDEAGFYWDRDNTTYYEVADRTSTWLVVARWVQFDDEPHVDDVTGDLPAPSAQAMAKEAGAWLLQHGSGEDGAWQDVPGGSLRVRSMPTPDLTY